MDTVELLKRVRRVEIKSRGLSDKIFSGEYAVRLRDVVWHSVRTENTSTVMKSVR